MLKPMGIILCIESFLSICNEYSSQDWLPDESFVLHMKVRFALQYA